MAAPAPTTAHRLSAEFLGTFVLVLGGCGAAVIAGNEIGYLGISLAFGLTVLAMAFAVGHISGGHFNPAVTLGLAAAKRFAWKDATGYVITQIVAAIAASAVLFVIASGKSGFSASDGFASNGYGDRSPDGYALLACFVAELVLTAIFLYVIVGTTDPRGVPAGFAPIAIGLALTLIHLVSIPVTNTSVNPARSIGPALFAGWDAIAQLWLFIVAPVAGGLLAGFTYRMLVGKETID
jgi:aquaporin Z